MCLFCAGTNSVSRCEQLVADSDRLLLIINNQLQLLPLSGTSSCAGAFSVRGTSMNRAKVEGGTVDHGDLILVRQQAGRANDIVVAMVDGEATVKRLVTAPGCSSSGQSPTTSHTRTSSSGATSRSRVR